MDLIEQLVANAKASKQRIVLPEGTEERTLKAANQILTDGVADLILLGNPDEIHECAKEWGLGNIERATIIDPLNHPKKEEYAQLLCELRKKKGMTIEEARRLVEDPLYLGCLIIKAGDADGQLAGARNSTGNVLRPALQIIKTAPGITCVSGAMLLLTHAPECGENGIIVMGDVAVTPVPTADQLAQIAVCTARTAKAVAEQERAELAHGQGPHFFRIAERNRLFGQILHKPVIDGIPPFIVDILEILHAPAVAALKPNDGKPGFGAFGKGDAPGEAHAHSNHIHLFQFFGHVILLDYSMLDRDTGGTFSNVSLVMRYV